MAKVHEFRFALEHLPYSPNLAPNDFHLFPYLKKFMRRTRLSSGVELVTLEMWSGNGSKILNLNNCIDVQGHYTEK